MNTYSPIVILPTVPSDLHTEIAADVLDCSNRLGVGWPVCVCVRVYRENFPLTCLDISYIDTRSINTIHVCMEITQICRIGDKEPKILINFVVHFLKQLIKLLHPHWQTFACTCMSVHVVVMACCASPQRRRRYLLPLEPHSGP